MRCAERAGLAIGRLALAALVGLAGCSGGPEYDGPPACILGGGVLSFIPMYEGAPAPILQGPQGGFHIWGSVLARNVNPKRVTLRFEYRDADSGALLDERPFVVDMSPATPDELGAAPTSDLGEAPDASVLPTDVSGWTISLGTTVFVPYQVDAGAGHGLDYLVGHRVVMSVELTDSGGRTCSDHHTIIPTYL